VELDRRGWLGGGVDEWSQHAGVDFVEEHGDACPQAPLGCDALQLDAQTGRLNAEIGRLEDSPGGCRVGGRANADVTGVVVD
jgi:hypothetical protein